MYGSPAFAEDFMDAKGNVAELMRNPLVRTLVSDPKSLDVKTKEVGNIAKDFEQAMDTLADKCRLLVQIQDASEKMIQ